MFLQPLSQLEGSGGGVKSELSKDDIYDLLAPDEKPNEQKEEVEQQPKQEARSEQPAEGEQEEKTLEDEQVETEDEIAELERELEGPTDEDLELVTPVRRKEILAKYPKFFKDFPYMEKAYYRDQQFTEIYPTINEAKEAREKAETFDSFTGELLNGNSEGVWQGVKERDPNAFHKMVDNLLPTLHKVDERAYNAVLSNVLKNTVATMIQEARASNNEVLKNTAVVLHQWVFGSSQWTPPVKLHDESKQPKQDESVNRERQEFTRQRFEITRTDLSTRVDNVLKSTIDQHIDTKKLMPEYVKKNASRDALENLRTLVDKDTRFRVVLDKMWEAAFKDGFSPNSVERIKSAYLSKCKSLLPSVIKKARIEALRGIGKRVKDENPAEEEQESPKNEKEHSTAPSRSGQPRVPRGQPQKGESTLDYFMRD